MNDDERLTELEIRFTHQQLLLEDLSDQIAECHRRIAQLEAENRRLSEMVLRALAEETPLSPDE